MDKWLIKIDRFAAWALFAAMLVYFTTGYGMTKGIISPSFALKAHLGITPVIITAFALHTSLAIRLAFIRWRIWGKGTWALLFIFYLLFFTFFIYLDQFHRKNDEQTAPPKQSNSATPTLSEQEKIFTVAELAKYNGRNNMPAYVAVDGVVYDVSAIFVSGSHFSHLAGEELTDAFYTQHAKSAILKYPVVGKLK